MSKLFFSALLSALVILPVQAQKINTDSIKAEMDKIELTNPAMKQTIEKFKKGVVKGDTESMNQLGMECMVCGTRTLPLLFLQIMSILVIPLQTNWFLSMRM